MLFISRMRLRSSWLRLSLEPAGTVCSVMAGYYLVVLLVFYAEMHMIFRFVEASKVWDEQMVLCRKCAFYTLRVVR